MDNIDVIAEASDGDEVLTLATQLKPDLILMDIHMPRLNGLESLNKLQKKVPQTQIIMVSMYKNEEYILRAIRDGAAGYLLKNACPEDLEQAIRTVMRGEPYLDARLSHSFEDYRQSLESIEDPLEKLTPRQREVLQLLAQGYSSQQMADTLSISLKTIEAHRSGLMRSLAIFDVAGLVRFAVRTGLVSAEA